MVDQESLSSLLDLAKDAALNAGNFYIGIGINKKQSIVKLEEILN